MPYEPGEYVITDALNATEPRNGRWQPVVIYGEQPANGERDATATPSAPRLRRPTFVLPPATAGFTDRAHARPMLAMWTDWCLQPGAGVDARYTDEWCAAGGGTASMAPYVFNMVLQGVDFRIGKGNPGAGRNKPP